MLPFWCAPFPLFVPAQVNIGCTELTGVTGGTVSIGAGFSFPRPGGSTGSSPSIANTMASVQGDCPFTWIGYGIVLDGQRSAQGNPNGAWQAGNGGGTVGARGAVDPPTSPGAVRYTTGDRPQTASASRSRVQANRPSGVTMIG